MLNLRELLWQVLGYGIFPAWMLAALADWLCHRHSAIELTSGPRESALHLWLHLEIAAPVLVGLYFEVDAGVLAFIASCVIAHILTSLQDTRYSLPLRYISPVEQQVHAWLEMLPLFALVLVAVLHAESLLEPHWLPRPRSNPVVAPWGLLVPIALAAGFALIVEEYLRGRLSPRL